MDEQGQIGLSVDEAQGTAVLLLAARGHDEAADLLEIASLRFEWAYTDRGREYWNVYMGVDLNLLDAHDDATVALVTAALDGAHLSVNEGVASIIVHPRPVEGDWRQLRRDARATGITNQAIRRSLSPGHPIKDGMHFRSAEEVRVYDALVRWQVAAPETDTITIAPNCCAKTRERVLEPDFLVTYRGKVAGIEVDGPHHTGRAAADGSRDAKLRDGGVGFVERIVVEDTTNRDELDKFVQRFIRRLER
jgi:hypothetical protein